MFQNTKVVHIFPVPIWAYRLEPEVVQRINGKAQDLIETLRAATPNLEPGRSWQTPTDLQDRPELEELMECAKAATRRILDQLRVEYGSFLITGCWANIKPKGSQPHPTHSHANNFLSGVYYLRAPKGGDRIEFIDPKPQTSIINPPKSGSNEYNSRHAKLNVETGLLIMFPSWLGHSVESNQGEEERISISFNVMFAEFGERMSKPKWEPYTGPQGQESM